MCLQGLSYPPCILRWHVYGVPFHLWFQQWLLYYKRCTLKFSVMFADYDTIRSRRQFTMFHFSDIKSSLCSKNCGVQNQNSAVLNSGGYCTAFSLSVALEQEKPRAEYRILAILHLSNFFSRIKKWLVHVYQNTFLIGDLQRRLAVCCFNLRF